jgi:hypothetical protein
MTMTIPDRASELVAPIRSLNAPAFSKCLLEIYGSNGHQCQAFSCVVIDDGQDAKAATDPRIKTVDDAVVRYFRSMFQVSAGAGTLALGLAHRSILRLLSADCCLLVVFP